MPRPRFAGGETYEFPIRHTLTARPLTQYLAARLSLPESWIHHLFTNGTVHVDGKAYLKNEPVTFKEGSTLTVRFPDAWPPHLRPVEMPLDILYEDEWIIVLNKPAGIIVHPARGHMDGQTIQNGVLYRFRDRIGTPETTIGPCHRLDIDTSGVLIFSLRTEAYRNMVELFTHRHPHKEYLALVDGVPDFQQTQASAPLGVDPDRSRYYKVLPEHEGGKPSTTDFYVLETGRDWALVRATPHTGRPHQVRVHLQHLGIPVIGDKSYNPAPDRRTMPRQALHAAALTLPHPITEKRMRFEAPLPDDMQLLLEYIRKEETINPD